MYQVFKWWLVHSSAELMQCCSRKFNAVASAFSRLVLHTASRTNTLYTSKFHVKNFMPTKFLLKAESFCRRFLSVLEALIFYSYRLGQQAGSGMFVGGGGGKVYITPTIRCGIQNTQKHCTKRTAKVNRA